MAIKFWFGKTGAEPGVSAGPSGDVPAGSSMTKETSAEKSAVFPVAESAQTVSEMKGERPAAVPEREVKPAAPGAGTTDRVTPNAEHRTPNGDVMDQKQSEGGVAGTGAGSVPGSGVAGAAVPAAAKIVLKAVGGGLRLAAQPAAGAAAAAPRDPAAGAPAHPMVFGLRPKAGAPAPAGAAVQAPVAAPTSVVSPAPAMENKKGVVERDADETIVRPKTDQRALYYQLMNGLYDALLILDEQGHVVDCSTRVEEMLGYSREDAWDLPIGKIIPGMSSQMFEHLKRNLAENHHILIDARCVRKDGSSFSSEVGVSTLSLTRGNNMVFAIRNVERRKGALEDLRKSRAALEVALVPAFVCDPEGFFLMVNPSLLEAFGIPDEAQAKSVRFMDLLPDAARFFLRAACGEKLREKMQVPTPGGVPVKLELSLLPVQSGQNVTAVAGSILQL